MTPPAHIAPARLFRLLLRRPRPRVALALRLRGAESVGLAVQALTNREMAEARDTAEDVPLPDLRPGRGLCELASVALVAQEGGARIFRSGAELADLLEETEAEGVLAEVCKALGWVSPTYARCDVAAWQKALAKGARDLTNLHDAYVLGASVDVALGYGLRHVTPRPDRYFGCALADLTDGQWMAFRVCRTLVEEKTDHGR